MSAGQFGRRGRSPRPFPKGRQIPPGAVEAVAEILGAETPQRDLLVEYLHRLHGRHGCLREGHLMALAEAMRLAPVEIYEVATFYAHFDILGDSAPMPPPVTVRVCEGVPCLMAGSLTLKKTLTAETNGHVRVVSAPCMGRCATAPALTVGENSIDRAKLEGVLAAIDAGAVTPTLPTYPGLEAARAAGGYGALSDCRAGRRGKVELLDAVATSGLRGLGGAGFPTARKWRLVAQQPGPRLMAVNADEGEPGTFKDRHFLETAPHQVLEGMLIAAWAVEAKDIYFYLRDEYPAVREILTRELAALERCGMTEGVTVHLRRGAGAYICGEESAMLESIEGKRGMPRHKPPYPAEVGLFGLPTLAHNVETLYWIPEILQRGAEWFAAQGMNGGKGLRAYSVSGRVRNPGVKIAPTGMTARAIIEQHCGGMAEGHSFRAYMPGGASGGVFPAAMADIPLDFGSLEAHGGLVGSAALIVLSDHDDVRKLSTELMRFFADESCGQCTPCRLGTEKALMLMQNEQWDEALLAELSTAMRDASICGLGQAAPNPLMTTMRFF